MPIEWTVHPARQRPRDAAIAVLVIVLVSAAAGIFGGTIWWALLAAVVLLLALNRFFFPSRFTIDGERITASYLIRRQAMSWTRVRRFVHDARGGYLSTRSRRSWTDAYRGLHVQFNDERDRIIRAISEHVAAARRQREASHAAPVDHHEDHSTMRVAVEGGAS